MSKYIIKYKDYITAIYYKDCQIVKDEFIHNTTHKCEYLAEDCREDFSLIYGKKEWILYQNIQGDICLLNDTKIPKIVLKNKANHSPNIIINSILTKNLRLIYSLPQNNEYNLITQVQQEDKQWSKPQLIETYLSTNNHIKLVELGINKYILLYSKNMPEHQYGYREISSYHIGEFKLIYSTGYNVIDYSYVITKDSLHFVFVISKGFSNSLVYIKKDSTALYKPIVIHENINIKKPLIAILHNHIYIWWITGRNLYYMVSKDIGKTFSTPKINRNINILDLDKATFVDKTLSLAEKYIFNEIYISKDSPYNTYFLNNIFE